MGDHLKVDTRELATMGRTLSTLRSDFENGTNIVDSYRGFIGSGTLADALGDFSSDWSKKRDGLCKDLDTLSKCATAAAKTYDGVDGHLADALLKADKKSEGSGK
jgi:hypothetical protein